MRPTLSICIPTYNRIDILKKRINEILTYKKDDLEIVILDNCSTDGTKEYFEKLSNDKRIKYYCNKQPLSPPINWIEVLKYAGGEWAYHLNDRDHVNGDNLPEFISTLNKFKPSCGYCEHSENLKIDYFDGLNAKQQIPFAGYHVSGLLFNMNIIRLNLNLEKYQNSIIFGSPNVEPHISLLYDLTQFGGWLSYKSSMSSNGILEEIGTTSGVVTANNDEKKGNMWFEPNYLIELYKISTQQILIDSGLNLSAKKKILRKSINTIIKCGTCEYCCYILSDEHRIRYGVSRYYISFWYLEELVFNIYSKCINYLKDQKFDCTMNSFSSVIFLGFARVIKFKIKEANKISANNKLFLHEKKTGCH